MRSVFVLSRAELGFQFADSLLLLGEFPLRLEQGLAHIAIARLGVVPLVLRFFLGIFDFVQISMSRFEAGLGVIQFSV